MKKLALISAIMMGGLIYNSADAQVGINIGFRLGVHRAYAPTANVAVEAPVYQESAPVYNDDDDYFYLPDADAYYNVAEQVYYYNDGYNWVSAPYLPGAYRNIDWRNARRYEIRAHRPYLNNDFYTNRYAHPGDYVQYGHDAFAGRGDYRSAYPAGQRYENRGWDDRGGQRDNHYDQYNRQPHDNRSTEGYGQHAPERQEGGYNQAAPQNHAPADYGRPAPERQQGGYSQPVPERQQGSNNQPAPERQQGGNSQPANNGQQRGNMNNSQPAQQNRAPQNNAQPSNNFGREGQNQHYADNRLHGGNERFGR